MPFAGYKDFADCVRRNSDKRNPEAYCASIEQATKRIEADQVDTQTSLKLHEDERLAFGWGYVTRKNGQQVTDHSGDEFDTAVMEQAAYEALEHYGAPTGEMHQGDGAGRLVEWFAATEEKWRAMGVPADVAKMLPEGLWIGTRLDAAAFARVKNGTRRMFSIQGVARRAS